MPVSEGPARAGEIRHSVAVVDALAERFDLQATTTLAEGLAKTAAAD